jgi:hypothetical protein
VSKKIPTKRFPHLKIQHFLFSPTNFDGRLTAWKPKEIQASLIISETCESGRIAEVQRGIADHPDFSGGGK